MAAWASVLASEAVNNSDAAIIAQRKKIENAPRARRRCTCEHPLLFDEDGEVRCFKCARPTARPMSAWVYGDGADLALPAYESFDMAEAIGLLDDLAEVTGPLESNVFITYPEPPPGDERIA